MLKVTKYEVISGPYFSVFSLNIGKYGPEITPYLDIFHVVLILSLLTNSTHFARILLAAKISMKGICLPFAFLTTFLSRIVRTVRCDTKTRQVATCKVLKHRYLSFMNDH